MSKFNQELFAPDYNASFYKGRQVEENFINAADEVSEKLFGKKKLMEAQDALFYMDKHGNIEKFDF